MKNLIAGAFGKGTAFTSLLLVLGVFFVVGFACNSGSKPLPPEYVGFWTGADGSTITLRADATGDYKSGGTSVSGGAVEINDADKALTIKLVGIGPSLKIDRAPSGNQMTLDGIVYKKNGGSDTTTSTKSDDQQSSGDLPSDSEVEKLLKGTFEDFAGSIDNEDFTDFYDNTSRDFQAANTKDQIKTTFSTFIDKKDQALPSLRDVQSKTPNFSVGPKVRTEKGYKILVAEGDFPSKPFSVKFETEYELEKGNWKILKFKVKM